MSGYATILLSRQPLRPVRNTPWVRQTVAAVRWLEEHQLGLVSSIGMQSWELLTTLASDHNLPLRLCLPTSSNVEFQPLCDRVADDFGLKLDRTEFVPVKYPDNGGKKSAMNQRDQMAVRRADLVLPVSVRKSGTMAGLIEGAEQGGTKVVRSFQTEYAPAGESLKLDISADELSREIMDIGDQYIVHWTRATSWPWPGERRQTFYRAILESETWPRSGLDTLRRILQMKRILASGRNMPDSRPTVSFSGLAPGEVVPLMRWRARYREMSFEPYGIGIDREIAARMGLRPVLYYSPDDKPLIQPDERWFWQSIGKITDWRAEKEYRHLHDLPLGQIPTEAIALFCMTAAEADLLREGYPFRVCSFLS